MKRPLPAVAPVRGVLQRKCACGTHKPGGGTCEACADEKAGLKGMLSIGASNDPLEHEADRVANEVLAGPRGPGPTPAPISVQRFAPAAKGHLASAPASVAETLRMSGRPLDSATRQDMEARFGHDFSQVRVHDDSAAAQSARDVESHAYTVGKSIVFGAGRYAPATSEGRRLLAHELTHTLQQGWGISGAVVRRLPIQSDGPPTHRTPGSTLPYREATEYSECLRIMGDPAYCRQEVLGEKPTPTAPPVPTPAACPLSIQGPSLLNHLCAAYVPSDAASCGIFPAPNITLTAQGAAPGAKLSWDIVSGGTLASIVGPANGATVDIKGTAASVAKNDVVVRVSNGTCSARHSLTVREPKKFTTTQAPTSGPSFVETIVKYTVKDQFDDAMGADICVDETITVCSQSHNITPSFGDEGTNALGRVEDYLRAGVASGSLPADLCIKLNQSLTAGGCGPLLNNTILYQPAGITLTPGGACAVGDACP